MGRGRDCLTLPITLFIACTCRKPTAFIDDDLSMDIFGEEGLAELNQALRELEDIQFSLSTGSFLNSL